MIRLVEGDILQAKTDAVAHGVAPNDDFKQGLAFTLREHWPAMYKDFRHYCHVSHPKEGGLWSWRGPGSYTVYNLFTQEAPSSAGSIPGQASLKNVGHSLKELAKQVKEDGVKSLSITRVATGVGGLDWNDVQPLIEKHLGGLDVDIDVYETYRKGVSVERPN